MRRTLRSLLALAFLVTGASAAAQDILPTGKARPRDPEKIAAVLAGQEKRALASWWGYDPEGATESLQEAVRSGVPDLVIDSPGAPWILNRPLQLVSNQRLHFQDGVVITAAKGKFKGKTESLIEGRQVSNVSLLGEGKVVLRMHREDYANPELYEKAEWRHGIAFWDSEKVHLRGLTVTETGGDGLYLGASRQGTNRDVLVEDMDFVANYRQGISVISAENLVVRRCRLRQTDGTAPKAGIDFEPNLPGQRLVNCLLEDCDLSDNAGAGVAIYTVLMNASSRPISITVKDCRFRGNSGGIFATTTRDALHPLRGEVIFQDCHFDHDSITLRNPVQGGVRYLFRNCSLDFQARSEGGEKQAPPILIGTDSAVDQPDLGDIRLENLRVFADSEIEPLGIELHARATIGDGVTGTLQLVRAGEATPYDLEAFVRFHRERLETFRELRPAQVDLTKLRPPVSAQPREGNEHCYLRNTFTYLQQATAGETLTLQLRARQVYPQTTVVELRDPDGELVESFTVPYDNRVHPLVFTAKKTGLYRLVRTQTFSQRLDIDSSHPGNGFLVDRSLTFLPLSGRLYFQVPAGVSEFSVGLSTDSTADVALQNAEGREVMRREGVRDWVLLTGRRDEGAPSEIWSIEVSKAKWALHVELFAPLVPLLSTNPSTLLLVD